MDKKKTTSKKEKEEYDREEREAEFREDMKDEGEKCPDCGAVMKYELISSDADGNRQEWSYMCPKCD